MLAKTDANRTFGNKLFEIQLRAQCLLSTG